MMLNFANYAQYERELISERTREAMLHMKEQSIRLGVAPYGYRHAQQLDDKGRRILEPIAAEQEAIREIAMAQRGLHAAQDRKCAEGKNPIPPEHGWRPSSSAGYLNGKTPRAEALPQDAAHPGRLRQGTSRGASPQAPRAGIEPSRDRPAASQTGTCPTSGWGGMPPPLRSCLTYRSEAAPVSAGESTPVARRRPQPTPDRRRAGCRKATARRWRPWHPATVATLISAYQHLLPPGQADLSRSYPASAAGLSTQGWLPAAATTIRPCASRLNLPGTSVSFSQMGF